MNTFKNLRILLLVAFVGVMGLAAGERFTSLSQLHFVSVAEAVVGRPLTPVSVAGVARRTSRRCAAGVYNC
jgi:hypothetical protein